MARALRTRSAWRQLPLRNGKSYKRRYDLQPAQSAKAAGLRYVSDDALAGIARRRAGEAFRYTAPNGGVLRDRATLGRIRSLAIPPAWQAVWICPHADGHLQATGRDARGRKQYRYHSRWREVRDETKYGRVGTFARALPRIRRRVNRDLALPGLPREKVLAAIVRLLETTYIRVGNEEYARQNASFGLTTLRDRQVRVRGTKLEFRFRGKSGVEHRIDVSDRRLAAMVVRMQDLPGEELFQYVDEDGSVRAIESTDVNAYLKEIAGDEFTSKDFRTWAGTVLAARALQKSETGTTGGEAKRNVAQAVEDVARQLGNTKAVCRKCYIHPAVLESYLDGTLADTLRGRSEESGIVALLQKRSRREADERRRSGARSESLAPLLARSISVRRAHHRSSRTRGPMRIARRRVAAPIAVAI
jgi:DNA topoisomerase I